MKKNHMHVVLRWAVQLIIVFIVGIIIARGNLIVNNVGSDLPSPYENFYSHLADNDNYFNDRSCSNSYTLEDRKKVRWVINKILNTTYIKSYELFGLGGVASSFLLIHAMFYVLCFIFIKLTIINIVDNPKIMAKVEDVSLLLFLSLSLIIFNGHVSEFSFSIIEGFCISAALYFSKVGRIIPFIFITTFGVLNRESAFLILLLWPIFNLKINKNLLYLLIPFILFYFANRDILTCMLDPSFFMGSLDDETDKSIYNLQSVLSYVIRFLFNYGIFLILMTTIFFMSKKRQIFRKEIKYIYMLYILYNLVFLVFTPMAHMSIKYIVISLIVVSTIIYKAGLIVNDK